MRMRDIVNWNRPSTVPVLHGSRFGQPLTSFQNEMNRLFDDFFGDTALSPWSGDVSVPAVDIIEDIKHFEVRAELPGMNPEDVEVTASGGFLTIKGTQSEEKEEKDRNYIRCETSCGAFQRTVALPETADGDKASEASFKNGVLSIVIPKKAEAVRNPKKIPVRKAA